MVNEPSVFEPLKFYFTCYIIILVILMFYRCSGKRMLERQGSVQSTRSSIKSSGGHLQKKVEELVLNTQPGEWQKEQEYNFRRNRRKQLEKQIDSKSRLKHVRLLFVPAAFVFFSGIIMLFGATLRNLSEGSVFWTHKQYFIIIGPVLIVIGLLVFFVAEGLQHYTMEKLKKGGAFELRQTIHPDFYETNKKRLRETHVAVDKQGETDQLLHIEDSFLCSSISSTSTLPDFASRWAQAMSQSFDRPKLKLEQSTTSSDSFNSTDSAIIRTLVNAPEIEITAPDISVDANIVQVNGGPCKQAPKTESLILNGKNGSLLRVDSTKSFQGFLEGISEESLADIRVERD